MKLCGNEENVDSMSLWIFDSVASHCVWLIFQLNSIVFQYKIEEFPADGPLIGLVLLAAGPTGKVQRMNGLAEIS
jgi:hypothetical protein